MAEDPGESLRERPSRLVAASQVPPGDEPVRAHENGPVGGDFAMAEPRAARVEQVAVHVPNAYDVDRNPRRGRELPGCFAPRLAVLAGGLPGLGCLRRGPAMATRQQTKQHRKDPIRAKVQASKDIREQVRKELEFDPLVDPSGITVKNMNGDVALNGTVWSYPQYRDAAVAAKRVKGVTKVHNHLTVTLPAASYRDDIELTTAANNALAQTASVPNNVEASSTDGTIWLTGMVRYGFERDVAEQAIAGLIGVRGIINDIEVYSDVETEDVTYLVQDALDRYSLIPDDSDVMVSASYGTITLTGHVTDWAEHDAVMRAAWNGMDGVTAVRDDLVITG